MFSKSSLGIQRSHDDSLVVRMEGSREELLVLLATLNAKVLKSVINEPKDYSEASLLLQQNTFKAYAGMLTEDLENEQRQQE